MTGLKSIVYPLIFFIIDINTDNNYRFRKPKGGGKPGRL